MNQTLGAKHPSIPAHLFPGANHSEFCVNPHCGVIAKANAAGRWFITMGHAGFNSAANNRNGYATQAAAEATSFRYANRGSSAMRHAIGLVTFG